MPATTLANALESNLAALGEHHADLVEAIREAESPESLVFTESGQDVPAATLDGRHLCSKHRPLDEGARLADKIDLLEHATVVVLGFGLGYHVQRLAERMGKDGLIVVFEPDVGLLRAVFEQIDHSPWLHRSQVLFLTDPDDRGALANRLAKTEALLGQGVTFLEHPASRARLGEISAIFSNVFTEHIAAARTTLATMLMRSFDTARNLLLNIDHYVGGPGIADLKNIAEGYPAVVVSAGPSLRKNIDRLAQPGVRDRCVIVAVQTALKPLLAAGVKPHYVTALDFHALSKRFYEDIDPRDLEGVTLIAEPKVNPVVPDAFPGPVRCCASPFLDKVLGRQTNPDEALKAGATVAHLALYVAQHLGCSPIMLAGQDLGFPDGLYYAPGTAIHDVWAPELNPFNTLEMMEWQRIARYGRNRRKATDIHGKTIFTDEQMMTYVRQFERDFYECKRQGATIIDATEGGVAKQHTKVMPLGDALERYATRSLPRLPGASTELNCERMQAARNRIKAVKQQTEEMRRIARQTKQLIEKMMRDQKDRTKMERHFRRLARFRKDVEARMGTFDLLNQIHQAGAFRRVRVDRRFRFTENLDPLQKQRAELDRDLDNVSWIVEAAQETARLLDDAGQILTGTTANKSRDDETQRQNVVEAAGLRDAKRRNANGKIAALIPIDPERNGLRIERSLAETIAGRTVIQHTLERIGRSTLLKRIVLIAPRGFDVDSLIDRERIGVTIEIERCEGSPFGPEQDAIAAARWWSETGWRGGISGMTVFDEVLCPRIMHEVMEKRGLTAAVLAAPDWPLIDPSAESGIDALIARHLEEPARRAIVFTQSPPGLNGCLVSASFMRDMTRRNRLCTIGGMLAYQPHAPQGDAISRPSNVQVDHRVRHSLARATFDQPRYRAIVKQVFDACDGEVPERVADMVENINRAAASAQSELPQHLILELTTQRQSRGAFIQAVTDDMPLRTMPLDLARRLCDELAAQSDAVLTLGGIGDPLLHEHFDAIIQHAKQAGVRGVHVRTELSVDQPTLDRLLRSGADVISVDLHAEKRKTYCTMLGRDDLHRAFENIEYLVEKRPRLTGHEREIGAAASIALPWIVPRLQRRAETYEEIEGFFTRWQHVLGTAILEGPPDSYVGDPLVKPPIPEHVVRRELRRRMLVLADGSVPICELDLRAETSAANANESSLRDAWTLLQSKRESQWSEPPRPRGENGPRLCFP